VKVHELRVLDDARQFVEQGLWLKRVVSPSAAMVRPTLEWSLELAAGGQPLPPVGLVADVGHLLLDGDREAQLRRDAANVPGIPGSLMRSYEDLLLGKLFIDRTIERAADAVRRYRGRDRARGVAFVVNQMRERAGFGGVLLSPAVIRGLLESPADEILARGWDSLGRGAALLTDLYREMTAAGRQMADALGPEDVFELEHGTALAELGQRVALRQVLHMAAKLDEGLPRQRPLPRPSLREVPTPVQDEDVYPVGGFASISTRGTIESLLHSQLAYMEQATDACPDLFDIKFVRDELLYYSRDENQFLRRRRSFVVILFPDLAEARFKDAELPAQRIVMTLAVLVVAVRKVMEWLSGESLTFDLLIVGAGEERPLANEEALVTTIFRDAIANGTVRVIAVSTASGAAESVAERVRSGRCDTLIVSTKDQALPVAIQPTRLIVAGPAPRLVGPDIATGLALEAGADPWQRAVVSLLAAWV
jgi:hypothetical protein